MYLQDTTEWILGSAQNYMTLYVLDHIYYSKTKSGNNPDSSPSKSSVYNNNFDVKDLQFLCEYQNYTQRKYVN